MFSEGHLSTDAVALPSGRGSSVVVIIIVLVVVVLV